MSPFQRMFLDMHKMIFIFLSLAVTCQSIKLLLVCHLSIKSNFSQNLYKNTEVTVLWLICSFVLLVFSVFSGRCGWISSQKIPSDFGSVSSLQERLQKHLHLQKPEKVNGYQGKRKTAQAYIQL